MAHRDPYLFFAGLYPTAQEAVSVARRAGLPIHMIVTDGPAIVIWGSILSQAIRRNMLSALQSTVRLDYPEVGPLPTLDDTSEVEPPPTPSRFAPVTPKTLREYEGITGSQPTFLPIGFLAKGVARARSVARVVCQDGRLGSGFLLDDNLLVTNNHVVRSQEEAQLARAEFGYELTEQGAIRPPVSFELDPARGFCTSPADEDDWTIVRVKNDANKDWGSIPLLRGEAKPEQFVNIVQHPGGGPKQIALYHNVVVSSDDSRVQYLTDTMPGSSGLPVFDSDWRLVAIHHANVWLRQPGAKESRFCNEGIAVNILMAALSSKLR